MTDVILHKVQVSTTFLPKKSVAIVGGEVIVTLSTFVEIFAV